MSVKPSFTSFTLPAQTELENLIVNATVGKILRWLERARPGLCGRLDDLPEQQMQKVAARLYSELESKQEASATVRLLVEKPPISGWECQWTEAVRLRNPDESGNKRRPFLLLVPPGTELLGSLDIDTFKAVPCEDVLRTLILAQIRSLPDSLNAVAELVKDRDIIRSTTEIQRVRYLSSISYNSYTRESVGLSLCLLGLWPHRTWLDMGDQRNYWLSKNRDVVSRLQDGKNSLLSRIYALNLISTDQVSRLYNILSHSTNINVASEEVAINQAWQDLDFSQWVFASEPNTVVVTIDPPSLPKRADGYSVLLLKEQSRLPLSWSVQPAPSQVSDLTHYLVELISTTSETIDTVYTSEAIAPGKSARKSFKVKDLASLVRLGELPEGLYRARVTAWAGGTNITRQAQEGEEEPNISAYFWIKDEGDEDTEGTPFPKKDRFVSSYLQARREIQWDLFKNARDPWNIPVVSCLWDGPADGKTTQGVCIMQFTRQAFRIRLSNVLRRIEYTVLSKPESLGILQAKLAYAVPPRDIPISESSTAPRLADNDPFLIARTRLFDKIRGDDGQGTVETSDLLKMHSEIADYVREYIHLLEDAEEETTVTPTIWSDRASLAMIDTIKLTLSGLSEQTSVALLLAPTHPLRLLWVLQEALLGENLLQEAQLRGSIDALTLEIKQALQGGLQPINMPTVLFDRRRVGYLQAGQVAPGWDVYLPADIPDKQSALARLARALACNITTIEDGTSINEILDRVLRYLKQHPYVSQLVLNIFNPGDGKAIVELLAGIDAKYPDQRYDIRLFSHEKVRDDLGSALDYLVNPTNTVGEGADKYSQSSQYSLFPNLSYSKNSVADFLAQPRRFQAHLSLLLDVFHPRIEVSSPFPIHLGNNLFGLVQEETTKCFGGQGTFAWERQTIVKQGAEITDVSHEAELLAQALGAIEHFAAALGASPSKREGRVPTIRLDLSVDGQNLLYEIHQISDWVLTADRHLGIDYFDSSSLSRSPASPGILLDFSPEFLPTEHPVLMLTTRVGEEVEHIVTPVLQRLGLDQPGCALKVIEWLRSLSGRLAMRLLSFPLASQGVIGMALARAFLGQVGVLKDAIIIPVDAHIQLLRKGVPDGEPETRTDLILARRIGRTQQIEFTLVEVKCIAGQLTVSGYDALRKEIENQTSKTQAALSSLFDPMQQNPDRLDRPMRNLILARWLRFYAGRARRYGTLSIEAEDLILELISNLDSGYIVSFRQAGLVFELGRENDVDDRSGEIVIHRISRSSCERLLRDKPDGLQPSPSWEGIRNTIRGGAVWERFHTDYTAHTTEEKSVLDSISVESPTNENVVVNELPLSDKDIEIEEPLGGATALQTFPIPNCHYLVGDTKVGPQWGVLGKLGSDVVGLDLNGCNTLSIFGVQGGGKSYTMGSILEMAIRPIPGINVLPHPLAAVVFHYNESQDYAPEFVTMAHANSVFNEIKLLREEYNAVPQSVNDIIVLTSADKVSIRRQEFPELQVEPIGFHPSELTIQDWRFLMGAVGNDSMYIKELNLVMRSLRDNITIEGLKQGIDTSQMTEPQRKLARIRLRFAEQFLSEEIHLRDKLYPGRLVIVDLRDELIETDEALGLFVVMLRVFAGATYNGHPFNKWIAFDEAHKYIRNSSLVDSVVEVIRQMRHQATSVLIASQDPASLPLKIMELSSLVMLHRMDSPGWLKYIQRAVTSLGDLTSSALARLRPGEAYLWARSATDPLFTHRAVKIQCRPRATQHGGATKEAVGME